MNASMNSENPDLSSLQTPVAFPFACSPKVVRKIFARTLLGVHFFNPPRYLHLVEVIRTEWTKPEVSCFLFGFLDQRLGKGVVAAKDRPNFIANRIGTFGALHTIKTMLEDGYSIEEVDKMTGPAVGRPKSATFRTFDLSVWTFFACHQEPVRGLAGR